MRLNLGCGSDIREGYLNVDFSDLIVPNNFQYQKIDLSHIPWPWADDSVEEILMLDFLEHFPYRDTTKILGECWRVLRPDGKLVLQVPDFEICARAACQVDGIPYQCNRCGNLISLDFGEQNFKGVDVDSWNCTKCDQNLNDISIAAIHRLYGGQDRPGNWHFTAFTDFLLLDMLQDCGFNSFKRLEDEHQRANWNMKFEAIKGKPEWSDQ